VILLLDTSVFIWWVDSSPKLKPGIWQQVADPDNDVFVGAPTIWEVATKRRIGKLGFTGSPIAEVNNSGFSALPITPEDAELAGGFEWFHKDPFDRMLVAQALRLSATFVTSDTVIRAFAGLSILWAG
jgi:PIN domain nuclease of toxin-antitoxin system